MLVILTPDTRLIATDGIGIQVTRSCPPGSEASRKVANLTERKIYILLYNTRYEVNVYVLLRDYAIVF